MSDLICATECATPEIINFMRKQMVSCVPLTEQRCAELDIA